LDDCSTFHIGFSIFDFGCKIRVQRYEKIKNRKRKKIKNCCGMDIVGEQIHVYQPFTPPMPCLLFLSHAQAKEGTTTAGPPLRPTILPQKCSRPSCCPQRHGLP
jgi:hypothetical protein